MYETVSDNPAIQAAYETMRRNGQSHMVADMLAHKRGPYLRTDCTFLEGHVNGNQWEKHPEIGDLYAAEAKRQGVDITGAVYKSGLASYPGDPMAWVRDRGDVERVAREKGMKVEGSVSCDYRGCDEPPEDIDVAPDIIEDKVLQMMDADPSIEHTRKPEDVYAEAKEAIKPSWSK